MAVEKVFDCDVVIIGAGPSGSVAAALLRQQGLRVTVLERSRFPRFSIGESLLPQCMPILEQAGLLSAVEEQGFQIKNGAMFGRNGQRFDFDFRHGFTPGWGTAYQVERSVFDQALADGAVKAGAELIFEAEVLDVSLALNNCNISYRNASDELCSIRARFCLDASGFGRVLARLLNLDRPSDFPVRKSVFTHLEGRIADDFDIDKILIGVHPRHADIWYWLIPFGKNRCSLGVVGAESYFAEFEQPIEGWKKFVDDEPYLKRLTANMKMTRKVQEITGYSTDIDALSGDGFAILGNAGEFLDPVFSSGVTIALKSASLAVPTVVRALEGKDVDWEAEYEAPLRDGVRTFRDFVERWYSGDLVRIFFYPDKTEDVTRKMCSILAGYAWDKKNPFTKNTRRRLETLKSLCA